MSKKYTAIQNVGIAFHESNIVSVQKNSNYATKYIFTQCLYLQEAFITEAKVSTRVQRGSSGVRTAPECCREYGWRWGVGVRWRDAAAAAAAAEANAGLTRLSQKKERACVLRRRVRCGAGAVLTKPGLRSLQQCPSGPCSCRLRTGWSSSGRTSGLHRTPAAYCRLGSGAWRPSDSSYPFLSSKTGPHSPESLPFPPLDSSSSIQNENTVLMWPW